MLNIINGGEIVNILNEKDMYGLLVKIYYYFQKIIRVNAADC